MIYDPSLLDGLQEITPHRWAGRVYRYMLGEYHPSRANTRGARWNPPNVAAIYTALERDTVIAELKHRLSLDEVRPRIEIRIYEIEVQLLEVLDLSSFEDLSPLGITRKNVESLDFGPCQELGGAVAWLEHDGLLVPSARADGTNLVIFPASQQAEGRFEVLGHEVVG